MTIHTHRCQFYLQLILLLIVGLYFQPLHAQGGAPPHVRQSVDAVVTMLNSKNEDPIFLFIDTAMKPSVDRDKAAFARKLGDIRDEINGVRGGVSIEAEPRGVRLVLRDGGSEHQLLITLDDDKISDLFLLEQNESKKSTEDDAAGAAERRHVDALEGSADQPIDALIQSFEREHFSKQFLENSTPEARRLLLESIKAAAAQSEGVSVTERGGNLVLALQGGESYEVLVRMQSVAPFAIDELSIKDSSQRRPAIVLERDSLDANFSALARQGFSGAVYVKIDGKVLLKKAYGMANVAPAYPVKLDTVFGIGSAPIDFTIAAVQLLAQEGRIDFDDRINKYFDDVPADKATMTVRHLLDRRSGLPDFFDTSDDWNPDLAWVDRQEAVKRLLSAPLAFKPGSDEAHSHAAFGLLAALVEIVSDRAYYEFIKENFMDPAGMTRTGMSGDSMGLSLSDFAVGGGPEFVGLPNIPPNWGPTSWLVMGSGGMYSTLSDMVRFYDLMRSGEVLRPAYAQFFSGSTASDNGSKRGFLMYQVTEGGDNEAIIMMNVDIHSAFLEGLMPAMERLLTAGP